MFWNSVSIRSIFAKALVLWECVQNSTCHWHYSWALLRFQYVRLFVYCNTWNKVYCRQKSQLLQHSPQAGVRVPVGLSGGLLTKLWLSLLLPLIGEHKSQECDTWFPVAFLKAQLVNTAPFYIRNRKTNAKEVPRVFCNIMLFGRQTCICIDTVMSLSSKTACNHNFVPCE